MRFLRRLLLLGRPELAILSRRLSLAILRLLDVPVRLYVPVLLQRASLLLVHAWLRPQHGLHPVVVLRIVSSTLLPEGTEPFMVRLLRTRILRNRRSGPSWTDRSHQNLLIQMSTRLSLTLFDRAHRRRWSPDRHYRPADHRSRRAHGNRPPRSDHAGPYRLNPGGPGHRSRD